jgi:hypothetical protein
MTMRQETRLSQRYTLALGTYDDDPAQAFLRVWDRELPPEDYFKNPDLDVDNVFGVHTPRPEALTHNQQLADLVQALRASWALFKIRKGCYPRLDAATAAQAALALGFSTAEVEEIEAVSSRLWSDSQPLRKDRA